MFFKQYDIFSAIFLEQIYRQFCAGLDHKTSMKTVNKLFSKNVYSYLHYSVEGGKNDASFDIHCQSVINSIEFASTKKNLPFTVFKPTAIGRIAEYEKSNVNQSIYNRFDRICKKAFENLSDRQKSTPERSVFFQQSCVLRSEKNQLGKYQKKHLFVAGQNSQAVPDVSAHLQSQH